jgi:hypothetical protein
VKEGSKRSMASVNEEEESRLDCNQGDQIDEGMEEVIIFSDHEGKPEHDREHEKHWKDFVARVNKQDVPRLILYMKEKAARMEKKEIFEKTLNSCIEALDRTSRGVVPQFAQPFHQEQIEHFDCLENDIASTVVSNHLRRSNLTKLMEETNSKWNAHYESVTANILGKVSKQLLTFSDKQNILVAC